MTTRVLITGASGFLGSNLVVAARSDHQVVAHSSRIPVHGDYVESVVADLEAVGSAAALVRNVRAGVVVNCAALADVDLCERDPARALRLNAEVPGEMAAACRAEGSAFIHVSTDAVFGVGCGPFTPATPPSPVNHYGVSKFAGEQAVLGAHPDALIFRINIVGWSPTGQRSLLELFHARLSRGEAVRGFTDVMFRPAAASDLWLVVQALLADGVTGIWHATGADLISKHEFGVRVARTFGFDPALVESASVADAGLDAARSPHLDVVPSESSSHARLSIDEGLERLRTLEGEGYRQLLASLIA